MAISQKRYRSVLRIPENLEMSESDSLYGLQSVSQSVCLGVEPTLWTFDQILLLIQELGLE
jgi:hypothetical protein